MTGDLGSEAGRARSRPSFLPPIDGYPPPQDVPAEAVPDTPEPRRGTAWILAVIAAASALLVSAFLPWARALVAVDLFGRSLTRDLGSLAGIDADDLVLAVPVLAMVAIALAFWDLIGRDARIGALAAIPGTLALLVCGIFVLRLGDVRDDMPGNGLDLGYQITVRYGWYIAVLASLLVVGFSLARPISERIVNPERREDQPHDPRYQYAEQQYPDQQYPDQQYTGDPYAAWPREDQAWGRREPEREAASPGADEPKRDQS